MNLQSFPMSERDPEHEAATLFAALQEGDREAAWRFKWEHPRFKGKGIDDVRAAQSELTLDDARMVVAQQHSFDSWPELTAFLRAVVDDPRVAEFEQAVDAVVSGDLETLQSMLRANPALVRARSARRHHCTLLHYLGANGVEGWRQRTPENGVAIMKALLDAGAEPDALADLYDHECTTMSMLVSSCHPADAGLQIPLAETLVDYGAQLDGAGSKWQSAVMTALAFGYGDTAEALAKRGATLSFEALAGLGRADDVARMLGSTDAASRHAALALAAQHGRVDVLRLLLDAGEDPNRYNPEGHHAHSTPLHQAVWSDRLDAVRLLVERGARLDLRDTIYDGTPLDWALYGDRKAVADYLRSVES